MEEAGNRFNIELHIARWSFASSKVIRALDAHWRTGPIVEKSTNEVDEFSSNFQSNQKYHERACAIVTPSLKETRTP